MTAASQGTMAAAVTLSVGRRRMVLVIQLVTLVAVLGVSVAAIPLADDLMRNQTEGYLALFVAAVLSGALFMLPGFGWAAIGAFAIAFENWWLPAIIGTTGQVIGEMYSYFLGYTGSRWIRRIRSRSFLISASPWC